NWICHNHSIYLLPKPGYYQLAFLTPGICPLYASSRKQIRQSLNLRYTECGRPQRSQRVYSCTLNLGVRFCFAIIDFLATISPPFYSDYFWNGIPNRVNNSRASSSVLAEVTMTISIPRTLFTLS